MHPVLAQNVVSNESSRHSDYSYMLFGISARLQDGKSWILIILNKCIMYPFSVLNYRVNRCPTVSSIPNSFLHSLPPWRVALLMYTKTNYQVNEKYAYLSLWLSSLRLSSIVLFAWESYPPCFDVVLSSNDRPEIGLTTNTRGMVGSSIMLLLSRERSRILRG